METPGHNTHINTKWKTVELSASKRCFLYIAVEFLVCMLCAGYITISATQEQNQPTKTSAKEARA